MCFSAWLRWVEDGVLVNPTMPLGTSDKALAHSKWKFQVPFLIPWKWWKNVRDVNVRKDLSNNALCPTLSTQERIERTKGTHFTSSPHLNSTDEWPPRCCGGCCSSGAFEPEVFEGCGNGFVSKTTDTLTLQSGNHSPGVYIWILWYVGSWDDDDDDDDDVFFFLWQTLI